MYLLAPPITKELTPVLACAADEPRLGGVVEKVQPSALIPVAGGPTTPIVLKLSNF